MENHLSPKQREEAGINLRLLLAYVEEFARVKVMSRAAAAVGIPQPNLYRLFDWLKEAGVAQPAPGEVLTIERTEALLTALAPGKPTGRPMKFPLPESAALALRGIVLARSTQDASHFALAVEEFQHHPACPPEIASLIRAELDRAAARRRLPHWPISIRRAGMPHLTETAWFRGPKHLQKYEHVTRRAMVWILEDGTRLKPGPHVMWESDDASDNQPRRSIDPDTGEQILTRQALWTQDVFSGAMLYLTQVARERDAYRIEDVADHKLQCVEAWGLPSFMRLEMGDIWNGRFFHGITPCRPGTTHVLPGWDEKETWGGLQPLCRVENVFKGKAKGGIESSFNMLQAMAAHRSLDIGRSRGEFEAATKALVRAHRATEIDERFWDMDVSPDAMRAVAERFNLRPKKRRAFGRDVVAPADLLRQHRGLPLLPSDRWRFSPVKKTAVVRNNHVEIEVDHYPRSFRFCVNGVVEGLHLDHGHTVLVAFHPGRPREGCWIFNAELGSRNRDGFGKGEKLIQAPYAEDVPQVDLSGHGDFDTRKKANAAVRRAGRAIGQAVAHDHAQDSEGKFLAAAIDAQGHRHIESHPPLPQTTVDTGRTSSPPQRPERATVDSIEALFGD